MRYYETMFIVKPTLTDEEREKVVETIQNIVTSNGGSVEALDKIGVRQLAYPIQKFERGYYYVLYFTGGPETIKELERQLRYNEDLLRFMSVKYETKRDIERWKKMVAEVKGEAN
jgi:small subunit ribosomal protein S6